MTDLFSKAIMSPCPSYLTHFTEKNIIRFGVFVQIISNQLSWAPSELPDLMKL